MAFLIWSKWQRLWFKRGKKNIMFAVKSVTCNTAASPGLKCHTPNVFLRKRRQEKDTHFFKYTKGFSANTFSLALTLIYWKWFCRMSRVKHDSHELITCDNRRFKLFEQWAAASYHLLHFTLLMKMTPQNNYPWNFPHDLLFKRGEGIGEIGDYPTHRTALNGEYSS